MPLAPQHQPRGAEIHQAGDQDNAQNSTLDGAATGENTSEHSWVLRFRGHDSLGPSL